MFALEVALAHRTERLLLTTFARSLSGPIHLTMRRYRFVEDNLSLGLGFTSDVAAQARQHLKLWNRLDAPPTAATDQNQDQSHHDGAGKQEAPAHCDRYQSLVRDRAEELLFPGLADILERAGTPHCDRCRRASYGAEGVHGFGSVQLCPGCRAVWRGYVELLPERAKEVYQDLGLRASPPLSTKDAEETKEKGTEKGTRKEADGEPTTADAVADVAVQRLAEEYTPETPRGMVNSGLEAGSLEDIHMD